MKFDESLPTKERQFKHRHGYGSKYINRVCTIQFDRPSHHIKRISHLRLVGLVGCTAHLCALYGKSVFDSSISHKYWSQFEPMTSLWYEVLIVAICMHRGISKHIKSTDGKVLGWDFWDPGSPWMPVPVDGYLGDQLVEMEALRCCIEPGAWATRTFDCIPSEFLMQ